MSPSGYYIKDEIFFGKSSQWIVAKSVKGRFGAVNVLTIFELNCFLMELWPIWLLLIGWYECHFNYRCLHESIYKVLHILIFVFAVMWRSGYIVIALQSTLSRAPNLLLQYSNAVRIHCLHLKITGNFIAKDPTKN